MTRTLAEALLLLSVAMNATLLIFIAGVLRKVMNDLDEATFKLFVGSLFHHSTKSPFMLTVLNIPLVGAIPYFYVYGLGNRWLIAGLALWLFAGGVGKMIKLPIYEAIAALDPAEVARLREERRKLHVGNLIQAGFNSLAVVLMTIALIHR